MSQHKEHITRTLARTKCIAAAARRSARAVTQLYNLVLSPTGMKATQFITLHTIAEAGEIAQWDLAERHAVATETLSRRLGVATRKGLLQVRRGNKHGEHLYSLTDRGYEFLEQALPHWQRAQERLIQAFVATGHDEIIGFLDRLTAAARTAETTRTRNGIPREERPAA